MKRYFFILFFLNFIKLTAQTVTQFPTPNAAAMSIYGQYPQSSFTGVPSIAIPIYDFNYNGFSLPIQLTYNTNSVKPLRESTWVGLGWNLNVGGAISRVVNGKPDDMNWSGDYDWLETHNEQMGYYFNHGYLSAGDWSNYSRLKDAYLDEDNMPTTDISRTVTKTIRDYSPDEFSFVVGGLSGTFYLDHNRQWRVRSKNKVKVIITSDDIVTVATPPVPGSPAWGPFPPIPEKYLPNHTYFNRITLIDDKGIRYVFGGEASAEEDVRYWQSFYIKTWYLTNVKFPNGKDIVFHYESGQKVDFEQITGWYLYQDDQGFHGPGFERDFQVNHPAYLKDIQTDVQKIVFFRSENPKEYAKLDSIQINRLPDNKIMQTSVLSYINTVKDRLKLVGLLHKGESNGAKSAYSFKYNPINFNASNKNTDFWGYYNTKPLNPATENSFYSSKEPDTLNCRAELLDQITYPTGGYTRYTWEPHSYTKAIDKSDRLVLKPFNENVNAGGVRIRQITNFDNNNSKIGFKRYSYLKNFSSSNPVNISSGVLYQLPTYIYLSKGYFKFLPYLPLLENNVGSHISYSEVTEINEDGSYTTTNYSNFDNGNNNEYMDEPAVTNSSSFKRFISNAHERGYPLSIRTYLNGGILKSEKIYQYERINKANEYVRSYTGQTAYSPPVWSASALKIYTNAYLPKIITETLIDSIPITNTSNYVYDPETLNLISVNTENSKKEILKTEYSYPVNMVSLLKDPDRTYSEMVSRNIISPVIERVDSNNDRQISLSRTNYGKYNAKNLLLPKSIELQNGSSSVETKHIISKYDNDGNVIEELQPNGAKISYQWGYNNQYPTVKILNAQTDDYTVRETAISGFLSFNKNKREDEVKISFDKDVVLTLSTMSNGDPGQSFTGFCSVYRGSTSIAGFSFCNKRSDPPSWMVCNSTTPDQNISLPAGTYTINIKLFNSTNPDPIGGIAYYYPGTIDQLEVGKREFFYEGFEESLDNQVVSGAAHTGERYLNGTYTTNVQLKTNRNYKIQWWNRVDNKWNFNEQPFNQNITLTGVIDDIRIFPQDALITTYTYKPLVGMTSEMNSRGITTYYEYDEFQRLKNVKDQNKYIIKNYKYNLGSPSGPTIFYNGEKSGVFTKNNCAIGQVGSQVTYTVPAGTISSSSQEDADIQALARVNANGQTYANANGVCTIKNCQIIATSISTPPWTIVGNLINKSTNDSYLLIAGANPERGAVVPVGEYRLDLSWNVQAEAGKFYLLDLNGTTQTVSTSSASSISFDLTVRDNYHITIQHR